MSVRTTLVLIAVLAVSSASSSEITTEDNVLVLTTDNFKTAISANEFILVKFYAPWCGHCKAMAPDYAKAASVLLEKESKIKLAKLDAQVHRQIANEYDVSGYPTLKYFRQGFPIKYNGGRQENMIIDWVEKMAQPPSIPLRSTEDVESFINKHSVALIGFFKDKESKEAKIFLEVANNMDDIMCGVVDDTNVFEANKVKEDGVILFKSFDERRTEYKGKFDVDDLYQFTRTNSFPLVIDFKPKLASILFTGEVQNALFLFVSSSSEEYSAHTEMAKKVATGLKGKVMILLLDTDDESLDKFLGLLGIQKEEIPGMRLMHGIDDTYGPDIGGIEEGQVRKFLTDYLDGKLIPRKWLKSQEVPSDWDKNPVKVLVGRNFHEVINGEKTVFVMFYAPWRGFCKQLFPIWEELGEKYDGHEKVIIAKIDASANDLTDYAISEYPTVTIFKGSIESSVVSRDRTLDRLMNFLRAHWIKYDPSAKTKNDDDGHKKDEL